MIRSEPVILHDAGFYDGWDDERRGCVQWRTLFSADRTPTEGMTAGVAEIQPGQQLNVHQHPQTELYYFLAGEGVLMIVGTDQPVRPGSAVFIPGNAAHGVRNIGPTTLRFFYVFGVDSFSEVEYSFQK